jgi:hypothetical protein
MPRDPRLYMTFPNDVHRHPKILRLSLEARWAFIEMNGEARLADNDGLFTDAEALFHWSAAVLEELCGSHPTRPLVTRESDGGYRIRDYAEHQQTRVEREALAQKRANAGRLGGKKQASAKQVLSKTEQNQAEIETETELETDQDQKPLSDANASDRKGYVLIPDDWKPTQAHYHFAASIGADIEVESARFVRNAVEKQRRLKKWDTGFTNWLKNSAVYAQKRQNVSHLPIKNRADVRLERNLALVASLEGQ